MEEDKRGANDAADNHADRLSGISDGGSGLGQSGSDDAASKAAELEALKAENTELKDKTLRLMAEMENLRRRTDREKSEFAKYAISEFARDVIGVGDNIRRAIEAVPKEAITADPALTSLVEGIEVTERALLKVLEKYQVKRFDPLGEPFNPHLHDAMTKIDVPNVPADTVVQVIHAGYMIDERVLRPAAVIVAKGGQNMEKPKPAPAQSGNDVPLPGAMKVPDDIDASPDAPSVRPNHRSEMQQNVLGRDFQNDRRRQSPQSAPDERVAQFRRPRSAAGDQSFAELRPQQQTGNGGGVRSSALHKPVIGSGGGSE
ncbi:MAG: nucleotide exchange factor GrpE [Rhodomicrobium sp.]|nr:nucleotide exchange factor GrpE [Rhodomicrobium sp.]